MEYKYFSEATDPLIKGLSNSLMQKLDVARGKAGIPFVITSGLRTPDGNSGLTGAVQNSAHLTGEAVDLAVTDDHQLFCTLFGLILAGFNRIGIYVTPCQSDKTKLYPRHIHVDDDMTKPLEVVWILIEEN